MSRDRAVRVGGVQWCTSLDFPGALSAVIFCQGCNLACRYCHNPGLIPTGSGTSDWEEILDRIKRRRGLLDAIVFSGGEPLIQSGLETAVQQVRALGMKVGLHTSGSVPARFDRVAQWVDWVGLDIKTNGARYAALTGRETACERAWHVQSRLVEQEIDHEIRMTVWPDHVDAGAIREIAQRAARAGSTRFVLQQARDPASQRPVRSAVKGDEGLMRYLRALFPRFEYRFA